MTPCKTGTTGLAATTLARGKLFGLDPQARRDDGYSANGAVEEGKAPDRIEARVNPAKRELPPSGSAQRSRPLCPWPQGARYAGGDGQAAASLRCASP